PAPPASAPAPRPAPATPEPPSAAVPATPSPQDGGRIHSSPLVRRMAKEHGIDLAAVRGTGAGGRISKQDIEALIAAGGVPAAAPPAYSAPGAPARTPTAPPPPGAAPG